MEIIEARIEKIISELPELPKRPRKNLFDILGVNNKETVNSRILAYFLDPKQDHGFGTLFIDSFLQIAISKKEVEWELIDLGEFKVSREEITSQAEEEDHREKRIDIAIKGGDWCIIIENKLYHDVENPFKAYWQHAKKNSSLVLGILLSLNEKSASECSDGDIKFANITHLEWIVQIQTNLALGDYESDTDIFYLREYIKTIKNHYKRKIDEPIMNNIIKKLADKRAEIQIIEKTQSLAIEHIETTISEIFEHRGYKKVNQLYCKNGLCFYVIPGKTILAENSLRFGFEAHKDIMNNVALDVLINIKNVLQLKFKDVDEFHFDKFKLSKSSIRLITYRKFDFLKEEVNIKSGMESILDSYFFNVGGIEQTVLGLFPEKIENMVVKD